jgi:hypothetical protein
MKIEATHTQLLLKNSFKNLLRVEVLDYDGSQLADKLRDLSEAQTEREVAFYLVDADVYIRKWATNIIKEMRI